MKTSDTMMHSCLLWRDRMQRHFPWNVSETDTKAPKYRLPSVTFHVFQIQAFWGYVWLSMIPQWDQLRATFLKYYFFSQKQFLWQSERIMAGFQWADEKLLGKRPAGDHRVPRCRAELRRSPASSVPLSPITHHHCLSPHSWLLSLFWPLDICDENDQPLFWNELGYR